MATQLSATLDTALKLGRGCAPAAGNGAGLVAAHGWLFGRHNGQLVRGRGRHHREAISEENAKEKFPKGSRAVKLYLRYTPQTGL